MYEIGLVMNQLQPTLQDNRFDLAQLVAYMRSKPDGDLAMYYGLRADELASSRGIVDVCPTTGRIKRVEAWTDSSIIAALFNIFSFPSVFRQIMIF